MAQARVPWRWIRKDGRPLSVEIGGRLFTVGKFKAGELDSYYANLKKVDWVFQKLIDAVTNVEKFNVQTYAGATGKLVSLYEEYQVAQSAVGQYAVDIGCFFEPAGAGKAFHPDADSLEAFLTECKSVLPAHAEDAVKPDPRPSARQAPPRAAAKARRPGPHTPAAAPPAAEPPKDGPRG